MTTIGVVLAGGRSLRMGKDKAAVEVAGRHTADIIAEKLARTLDRVVFVGRAEGFAWEAIGDDPGLLGPAAGIATALRQLDRPIVVVGVDQPWVRTETITALAGADGSAIPHDDWLQVTCARYDPADLDTITQLAEDGRSLQETDIDWPTIEPEEWATWGEDGRSWFSVDTPSDLDEGLRRWGPPPP